MSAAAVGGGVRGELAGGRLASRAARVVAGVVLAWLFVLPLAMLVYGALRTSPFPPAQWTTAGLDRVYGAGHTWRVIGTTGAYATVTAVLGTAVAVGFALVATRSNAPLRWLVTPSMIVLLAVPKAFYALAWAMVGSGSGGLVGHVLGTKGFDLHNWIGVELVSVLKSAAIAYLLLLGPIRAADPASLEAARVAGARPLRAFVGIELPMLAPALMAAAAFVFVLTLQEFEVPAILGLGADIRVFSTSIYQYLLDPLGPDYTAASSASLLLVAIVAALVIAQIRVIGQRSFVTVGARPAAARTTRPSRWRFALTALIVAWIAIAVVLPIGQMVAGAFQPYFGVYGHWTTKHFGPILHDAETRKAVVTTVAGSIAGGLVSVLLAFALAYGFTRRRGRVATLARFASWIPATMPGLVFGLALLWVYTVVPGLKELFGTPWPLLIGLVVSVVPFAVRALEGALVQISGDLEEAARVNGDSFAGTLRRVVVPLTRPAVLAAWLLTAFVISGTLDVPLLLADTSTNTVSTLTYSLYQNGSLAQAAALYCSTLAVFVAVAGALLLVRKVAR